MLEFFATSGDFTRRLTSVRANPKFSSPLAGPEDFYSVSLTFSLLKEACVVEGFTYVSEKTICYVLLVL